MLYVSANKVDGFWAKPFEKRNPNPVPINEMVYAFAYDIDNDNGNRRLSCEPIAGKVLEADAELRKHYDCPSWASYVFIPMRKDSTTLRRTGVVDYESRYYADTYEEAVEGYNSLVQDRIDRLHEMEKEAKGDMIFVL